MQDLAALGVDGDITDALALLTHEGSSSYEAYLERILTSGNALALAVKRNDLQDNLTRNDRTTALFILTFCHGSHVLRR